MCLILLFFRNIFLWNYIKDHVFMSFMPRDLQQLRVNIIYVVADIDYKMLGHVCSRNLNTILTFVTKGGYIEHL